MYNIIPSERWGEFHFILIIIYTQYILPIQIDIGYRYILIAYILIEITYIIYINEIKKIRCVNKVKKGQFYPHSSYITTSIYTHTEY